MHNNFEAVKIDKNKIFLINRAFYVKRHDTFIVFTWNARFDVQTSSKDCKQSTEAINWKQTPGTAPRTQLSGEVSCFFFVSRSVGPPTLTKWKPAAEL